MKSDEQLIFCKGCHKFKPIKGATWDLIFRGFVCKDCYNKLLKTFDKGENKQTDVSVDPYDMKYIRCGKGE